MADLIPKRNSTVGSASKPLVSDMATYSLAVNGFTGRAYVKQENGTVTDIAKTQLAGDVTGVTADPTSATDGGTIAVTVYKLIGRMLDAGAPTTGQAYVWNSTSNRWLLTAIPSSSDFTGSNQSLSGTGYQKLAGGVILQWGLLAATSISASSARSDSVTYPIAFPTACFAAFATPQINAVQATAGIGTTAPTTTSMSIERRNLASSTSQSIAAFWFAIGY